MILKVAFWSRVIVVKACLSVRSCESATHTRARSASGSSYFMSHVSIVKFFRSDISGSKW